MTGNQGSNACEATQRAATVQIREGGLMQPVLLDPSIRQAIRLNDGGRGPYSLEAGGLRIQWQGTAPTRYEFTGSCYVPGRPAVQNIGDARVRERALETQVLVDPKDSISRVAVITAYYREPRAQIERAISSVKAQTISADHILVADGQPQDWVDKTSLRHVKLDKCHRDYGNTPRGVGALLAISEDYDAICFLDADNWLEPDHVESAIAKANSVPTRDFLIARRWLRKPDESILPVPDEPIEEHVDTNCFFFLRGAFHAIPYFSLIPRELSCIGDRVFYKYLRSLDLSYAVLDRPTVNYHCLWESLYRLRGEIPPPGAKSNIDTGPLDIWLRTIPPRHREYVNRRCGGVLGAAR